MSNEQSLPSLKRDPSLMEILSTVNDPDLHIPITAMGLIYGAQKHDNHAEITMTLTTVGCPLFDVIKNDIESALLKNKDIETVSIELTFDPPWHPGMMSEEIRAEMGFF